MVLDSQRTAGTLIQRYETTEPLILAVDDHEDDCLIMTLVLEHLGYSNIIASDGQTALELAQFRQPSLILLDICLPDMDGLEVIYRLRQDARTADIPVIAITALVMRDDRQEILTAGFDDYLAKPYSIEALESILHNHCPIAQLP